MSVIKSCGEVVVVEVSTPSWAVVVGSVEPVTHAPKVACNARVILLVALVAWQSLLVAATIIVSTHASRTSMVAYAPDASRTTAGVQWQAAVVVTSVADDASPSIPRWNTGSEHTIDVYDFLQNVYRIRSDGCTG